MNMTISERLARAIQEKDISLRDLSDATGVSRSAIQRYTSGGTEKIPVDRLEKLAFVLGIDPAYFFGWDNERPAASPEAPSVPADPLTPDEGELLGCYRAVNREGRTVILGTARAVAGNPEMQKSAASSETA